MSKQIIPRVLFRCIRTTSFRLLIIALALTGLTVSAWAWLMPVGKVEPATPAIRVKANSSTPIIVATQDDSAKESGGVELITLQPEGFEPSELTRPATPFLLAFKNRSGQDDISLQVITANGVRERTVHMPRGKGRSLNRLDLPPGQYILTEASHPEWVCRIRLTQP